jgi:thiol-disulfide isomerase/thioredoxin
MAIESLNRRKMLTYLGLAGLGLGAVAIAHQFANRSKPMNLSAANPGRDHAQVDPQPMPPGTHSLPEFQGIATWLNSDPLTVADLKGKVVLVQIWTFACINCQRTLPSVTRWHRDYASRGLKLIGVHTPEFAFERDLGNVKKALTQRGITYPIAIDNNYQTWKAYQNEYWPHLFLADRQGMIQYDHIGEGAYDETEQKIRELLG